MKKILLFGLVLCSIVMSGQTLTRRKTIKNINLGVLKLEQIITEDNDTSFAMMLATTNDYHPYIVVALGNRQNAIRLLKVMNEAKLGDDDILSLDNETNNVVTRGLFGGIRIHSEGRQFSKDVGKNYIRSFLKVLQNPKKDDEEE